MAKLSAVTSAPPPPDAAGHRERLRHRLLQHGGEALQDYELIEYLLALVIRRRDTKPIAKALLREFGGIGPLLAASPEALMRVPGMGEMSVAAVRVVGAAAVRMLQTRASAQPILSSWQALLDYLQADMAHIGIERVRVLHLDSRNRLIRDEMMWSGTIDQAAVHVREVIARALELKSAALILVHNHPSGNPQPSRQDIALTRQVIEAGSHLGIALHDHVIIGSKGHASMKALGLI